MKEAIDFWHMSYANGWFVRLSIVDKAVEYKLGARGLRSIVETVMMDVMFDLPSMDVKEYVVTLEYAKQQMEKANLSRLQMA